MLFFLEYVIAISFDSCLAEPDRKSYWLIGRSLLTQRLYVADIVQFDGVLSIFVGGNSLRSALQNERAEISVWEEYPGARENYERQRTM